MKLGHVLLLLFLGFVGGIGWLLYDPAPSSSSAPSGGGSSGSVELQAALASGQPVLVEFYADWCPPCRQVAPDVAKLAAEVHGKASVLKINTDHHRALAQQYGIRAIPTFIAFQNGKESGRQSGAISSQAMRQMIGL